MKLKQKRSLCGQEKALSIGLQSNLFKNDEMTQNTFEEINRIKLKDRSGIQLSEWGARKLYETDVTQKLFSCPQNVNREEMSNLSVEEFVEKYQKKNFPVVIRGCTENWKKQQYWTFDYFFREFAQEKFKIGEDDDGHKLRLPLKYYFEYLVKNKDDSPLYLFESSIDSNSSTKKILDHYNIPPYFHDDLLKYVGERDRPPYRWLLMGPQRSGSTIHIDPLLTSAWNTSLNGHKRWVLFPQNIPKTIVKGKAFRDSHYQDQAISYFSDILPKIIEAQGRERLGIIEFIQKPGETVFVPSGWWHAVINLDDTMAVTQNVMTHANFERVWGCIRFEKRKFAKSFLENLKKYEPDLYKKAVELNEQKIVMGEQCQKKQVPAQLTPSRSLSSSSSRIFNEILPQEYENQENYKTVRSCSISLSRQKLKKRKTFHSQEKKSGLFHLIKHN